MDTQAKELAGYLVSRLDDTPSPKRLIVGISGIPASGKSTLARLVVEHVNELLEKSQDTARGVLVELDGWHLTRAQLDALPDPQLAHDRRGAHWTFDAPSYVQFVLSLRLDRDDILAPSFDHAIKDPTPKSTPIHPHHRIVVIEGLYTFLSIDPWKAASRLLDERWWIEVDEEEARRRLIKRHLVSGIVKDVEEASKRAEQNDLPNGRFIQENMLQPTRIIKSQNDDTLA